MKNSGNIEKYYQHAFPMQTALITCNDENGKTNIITVSWHTPISKNPPLYGISLAPSRYSHELIKRTKEFVINFVPYQLVEGAHFCGTHSGRKTDKINETKLTLLPSNKVKTPMIKEGYTHLECKLIQSLTVGDHTLFIGEVVAVQEDENTFQNDLLQIDKVQPLYYIGGNSYTTINGMKKKKF